MGSLEEIKVEFTPTSLTTLLIILNEKVEIMHGVGFEFYAAVDLFCFFSLNEILLSLLFSLKYVQECESHMHYICFTCNFGQRVKSVNMQVVVYHFKSIKFLIIRLLIKSYIII